MARYLFLQVTADGFDNVDTSYINKHLLPIVVKNIGYHLVLPALVVYILVPTLFHVFPAEMFDLSTALTVAMHRRHLSLAKFSDNFPLVSWLIFGPLDVGFFAEDVSLRTSIYEHFLWMRVSWRSVEWLHGSYGRLQKRVFADKYVSCCSRVVFFSRWLCIVTRLPNVGFFAEDASLRTSMYEHFLWMKVSWHSVEWLHGLYGRLKKRVFADKCVSCC